MSSRQCIEHLTRSQYCFGQSWARGSTPIRLEKRGGGLGKPTGPKLDQTLR